MSGQTVAASSSRKGPVTIITQTRVRPDAAAPFAHWQRETGTIVAGFPGFIEIVAGTIVEDEDYQPTKSEFLKTPVPTQDALEPDWSAWDSGKPKDWNKHDEGKFYDGK